MFIIFKVFKMREKNTFWPRLRFKRYRVYTSQIIDFLNDDEQRFHLFFLLYLPTPVYSEPRRERAPRGDGSKDNELQGPR
jgi:hypothetical protein